MYYLIEERTFHLNIVYNRSPENDLITQTKADLRKHLDLVKDWSDIRLEKEIRDHVLTYDPRAVRVYLCNRYVANIPFPNSPIVNVLIDLVNQGLVCLESMIHYTKSEGEDLELQITIRVLTSDETVANILDDIEFTEVDKYLAPVRRENEKTNENQIGCS